MAAYGGARQRKDEAATTVAPKYPKPLAAARLNTASISSTKLGKPAVPLAGGTKGSAPAPSARIISSSSDNVPSHQNPLRYISHFPSLPGGEANPPQAAASQPNSNQQQPHRLTAATVDNENKKTDDQQRHQRNQQQHLQDLQMQSQQQQLRQVHHRHFYGDNGEDHSSSVSSVAAAAASGMQQHHQLQQQPQTAPSTVATAGQSSAFPQQQQYHFSSSPYISPFLSGNNSHPTVDVRQHQQHQRAYVHQQLKPSLVTNAACDTDQQQHLLRQQQHMSMQNWRQQPQQSESQQLAQNSGLAHTPSPYPGYDDGYGLYRQESAAAAAATAPPGFYCYHAAEKQTAPTYVMMPPEQQAAAQQQPPLQHLVTASYPASFTYRTSSEYFAAMQQQHPLQQQTGATPQQPPLQQSQRLVVTTPAATVPSVSSYPRLPAAAAGQKRREQNGSIPWGEKSVTLRAVVNGWKAGTIIGKGGSTISKLRADSRCRITVSDDIRQQDRIFTVTGPAALVADVFQKVCLMIAASTASYHKQQRADDENASAAAAAASAAAAAVSNNNPPPKTESVSINLTLAVPSPLCGCLIGRGGQQVKLFRQQFGVSFAVASTTILESFDRPVSIGGAAGDVAKCLVEVCRLLATAPSVAAAAAPNEASTDGADESRQTSAISADDHYKREGGEERARSGAVVGSRQHHYHENQQQQRSSPHQHQQQHLLDEVHSGTAADYNFSPAPQQPLPQQIPPHGASAAVAQSAAIGGVAAAATGSALSLGTAGIAGPGNSEQLLRSSSGKPAGRSKAGGSLREAGASANGTNTSGSREGQRNCGNSELFHTAIEECSFELSTGELEVHLLVPNDIVGCIIGKGGRTISDIRESSGAFITITESAFPPAAPPNATRITTQASGSQREATTPTNGGKLVKSRDRVICIRGLAKDVRVARYLMGSSILTAQRGGTYLSGGGGGGVSQ